MRKILNNIAKTISYVISNFILPTIAAVIFTIFVDLAKVIVSSNKELMTMVNQIKGGKSVAEIMVDFQHSISLLTVAYISVVLCIDSIGKIRIWSIDSKERNEQNYFYGETLNKFSGERKINYLRI